VGENVERDSSPLYFQPYEGEIILVEHPHAKGQKW